MESRGKSERSKPAATDGADARFRDERNEQDRGDDSPESSVIHTATAADVLLKLFLPRPAEPRTLGSHRQLDT